MRHLGAEIRWWLNLLRFLVGYSRDWIPVWLAGLWACLPFVSQSQVSSSPLDLDRNGAENERMRKKATKPKPSELDPQWRSRPRKAPGESRPYSVYVRLTPAQREDLATAARLAGITLSDELRRRAFGE